MDLLVLDLDGTLVDTLDDLTDAFGPVFEARSLAPIAAEEVKPLIGDGLATLVARAFARRGADVGPEDRAAYAKSYEQISGQRSRLYPGARNALDRLAADGWTLAVCTNKPQAPARALLEQLGVAGRFVVICGGDTFPVRKPDPAHVAMTVESAGGALARTVMVGDLRHDLLAARGAFVPSIWVSWGDGSCAAAALASAVAERWADIPNLSSRLLGRS